jgi:hypothetical protein
MRIGNADLRGVEESLSFLLCFSVALPGASAVNWERVIQLYLVK